LNRRHLNTTYYLPIAAKLARIPCSSSRPLIIFRFSIPAPAVHSAPLPPLAIGRRFLALPFPPMMPSFRRQALPSLWLPQKRDSQPRVGQRGQQERMRPALLGCRLVWHGGRLGLGLLLCFHPLPFSCPFGRPPIFPSRVPRHFPLQPSLWHSCPLPVKSVTPAVQSSFQSKSQ
jgi:hypothetical protein